MEKTILGKTGIESSRIIFGGMIIRDEEQTAANRYVSEAIDMGVNFFDVAPGYGDAEVKLGPALKSYRSKVALACKTFDKKAADARKSIENSLKVLQTDYFDLFQLHCLSEVDDVDKVFAEDGAMPAILEAQKKGLIKHIGLTAHNEDTALLALEKFDFESIMFPINWALDLGIGFGSRIPERCKKDNIGLIAMKSLAHRKWRAGEEAAYPKSWVKPICGDDRLAVCALKYALYRHSDTIVPPGTFEQFCFAVKHLDECIENPLNDDDMAYLRKMLPSDDEQFFVVADKGRQTSENRI